MAALPVLIVIGQCPSGCKCAALILSGRSGKAFDATRKKRDGAVKGSRGHRRSDRLSPEAGWILVLVLSLPTDWSVRLEWLAERRRLGRDRTRATVKELQGRGYCLRRQTRKPDGTLGPYEFGFTDEPGVFGEPAPDLQGLVRQLDTTSPAPENPTPDNPSPTKQDQSDKTNSRIEETSCG